MQKNRLTMRPSRPLNAAAERGVRRRMTNHRWLWQDYTEWTAKIAFAFLFVYVGRNWAQDNNWGLWVQVIFWPVYVPLAYWLVIREIHFKRSPPPSTPIGSLKIRFNLQNGDFGSLDEREQIHAFTDTLAESLADSGFGQYDGDEFGGGTCTLFMYGDDPEKVFKRILPLLAGVSFMRGAEAFFTAPGSTEPYKREVL